MGPCILICQHSHVLNNQTLMNHFPFGREREKKKHSSSVWHHTFTVCSPWQEHTQITANSPKISAACICATKSLPPSPSLCLSYLSLSRSFSPWPSFSLCCVAVIFHCVELAEAVNTLLLRLWTQSDPTTSVSLIPLPRSLIPRPLCCSAVVAAHTL